MTFYTNKSLDKLCKKDLIPTGLPQQRKLVKAATARLSYWMNNKFVS